MVSGSFSQRDMNELSAREGMGIRSRSRGRVANREEWWNVWVGWDTVWRETH